jgi:hypothetical protein
MKFEVEERLKTSSLFAEPNLQILGIEVNATDITDHIVRIQIFYSLGDGITTGIFDESLSVEDLKR